MSIHPEDWELEPNQETSFTGQSVPPYNVGDTWVDDAGNTFKCVTAKTTDEVFAATDWELLNPGLGTLVKYDDPALGIIIYFEDETKTDPWNHGPNIQLLGDRINVRIDTSIVGSWVGRNMNLGNWQGTTAVGDSAQLSLFEGSAVLKLIIGATRDLLQISSGDIQILANGITLDSNELMHNQGRIYSKVILYDNPTASSSLNNIIVSNSFAQFDYVEIFYSCNNLHNSVKITNPNGKTIQLNSTLSNSISEKYQETKRVTLSGITMSWNPTNGTTGRFGITGNALFWNENQNTSILKVVGYKQ